MPSAAEMLLFVIAGVFGLIGLSLIITSLIFDLPPQLRKIRDRKADQALREMKYFNILIR